MNITRYPNIWNNNNYHGERERDIRNKGKNHDKRESNHTSIRNKGKDRDERENDIRPSAQEEINYVDEYTSANNKNYYIKEHENNVSTTENYIINAGNKNLSSSTEAYQRRSSSVTDNATYKSRSSTNKSPWNLNRPSRKDGSKKKKLDGKGTNVETENIRLKLENDRLVSELEQDRGEFEEYQKIMNDRCDEYEKEINALKTEMKQKNRGADNFQHLNKNLIVNNSENEKIRSTYDPYAVTKIERVQKNREIDDLQQMNKNLKASNSEKDEIIRQYEETIKYLKEQKNREIDNFQYLNTNLEASNSKMDEKIRQYEEIISALKTEKEQKNWEINNFQYLNRNLEASNGKKDEKIRQYEEIIDALKTEKDGKNREINNFQHLNKNLEASNSKKDERIRQCEEIIDALKTEKEEKNLEINNLKHFIKNLEENNSEQCGKKIHNPENRQQVYDSQGVIKNLQGIINEKEVEIRSLKKQNIKLKEEASHYQSALGEATSFQMGDDDQNNTVQLKNDIEKLQDMIEDYVTNLKVGVNVDLERVKQLLQDHNCRVDSHRPDRLLLKALLQRHATELTNLLENFSVKRLGNDQVTGASSIKIRQLVFAILGNRGFSKMENQESEFVEHEFIVSTSNELNRSMNQYRMFKDAEKKKNAEELSRELVRDLVRLFYFRFEVQEPRTQFSWFSQNSNIVKRYMKGQWDDDVRNLVVEICHFPLIGKDFDSGNPKIYTLAKVYPREL
ncbi:3808_t:CDS:2 [Acaulospora colombiana]|uniref:3808_t:CDS:1 n=1 Tax=Acaulospora colombiana TaxID=27376 RepID=A0ACA9KLY4_9GLOM|nr:3808_t:CDS:2 [Acaulospora colombiana]